MALQSEVSPPMVGDPNTVKQIGETKSEENDIDDNEGSQSTDEEVDLEDGEIPDSEEEEKDFTHSSLKEALDESCLQDIEKLVNKAKQAKIIGSPNHVKISSPRKINKMPPNYMDHDRNDNSDHEDGWVGKYKSKFESKHVDYRDELNEFRGTPPSSPERKHDKSKRRKSSKKSKKSRKSISRKDVKGMRVKYIKEAAKGRICKFFKEGKCNKGPDCMFSHPAPFRKKELCKFYLNGHCNKGRDCIYMHHEFPCKFYHTGNECYAKDKCRFSHAPLSDEMKKVLADYLRMTHGDDRDRDDDRGRDRKRRMSPEPKPPAPPPKRKCLLGSPPRHIKEADETKQWQEEMKKLGSQNIPGFEIHLEEECGNMTPPHFQKPNFYKETLNTPSPLKRQGNSDGLSSLHGNSQSDYEDENEGSKLYVYDDDEFIEITVPPVKKEPPQEYHWKNAQSSGEDYSKPYAENSRPDCDFSSDIKFDETTQFSEMESSVDGPPPLSPDLPIKPCATYDSRDSDNSNQDTIKVEDASGESNQEPPAPSIQVPSHLPRKQQELLMRVLQHQRLNAAAAEQADSPSAGENFDFKKEESEEEVVIKPAEEENDGKWYSSEEDDDDSDQPLTDVLKKIQQAPPSKPQIQGNKPSVNILDMFNKIQQKTMENKGFSKPSPQKATDFWANILQGTKTKAAPAASSSSSSDPKRQTLLPEPAQSMKNTEASATSERVVIKDPRLKNQDPRLKSRDPRKLAANLPINSPKLSPDRSSAPDSSPPIQDSNPLFSKPLGAVTGEPSKDNIPYKLRSISAAPPNYTPYLSASQSNPNLLKDPRLRRHLRTSVDEPSRNGKDHQEVVKPATSTDAPPMPELLRKYTKPVTAINIFESSSSSKSSMGTSVETKPSVPVKVFDPRMQRRDSRSNSNSSCDTPPHLTIVDSVTMPSLQESKAAPVLENALEDSKAERRRMPPVLEKSWTPVPLKDWKMAALKVEDIKKEPGIAKSEELGSNYKNDPVAADTKIEPGTPDIKKEPGVSDIKKDPKSSLPEKREFSLGSFPEKSELGDLVIKEEPMSDSENSLDPSRLELGSDSSHKKSPSPLLNEEFITVIKEEVTQDSNNDSHPVVPPLIIKKVKPTVASHLPRAIADPRMAKLHTRVEPRRPRALGSDAKSTVDSKSQPIKAESKADGDSESSAVSDLKNVDVPKAEVKEAKNAEEIPEKTKGRKPVKEAKGKLTKSIPKKRRLSDKGDEKKKPAHRNRKSSMDYASPLNSCDSTNSGKSLDYNNYNQRPKRTVTEKAKTTIDTTLSKSNSSDTSIPDFVLSDNSNLECDNSNDVNLKDRFKTIDPTASPFC